MRVNPKVTISIPELYVEGDDGILRPGKIELDIRLKINGVEYSQQDILQGRIGNPATDTEVLKLKAFNRAYEFQYTDEEKADMKHEAQMMDMEQNGA